MPPTKISAAFDKLKAEWSKKESDLDKIESLVEEFQDCCALHARSLSTDPKTVEQFFIQQRKAREILVSTLCLKRDVQRFPAAMNSLKQYYLSKTSQNIPESEQYYEMIGLNLMYLLALNKLSEFSMETARIPTQIRENNPYICLPIQLEHYMNVGLYNKIFLLKVNMPSPYYQNFMEIFLVTVRNEIASCIEKSYEKLSVKQAASALFFDGPNAEKDAIKYGQSRNWTVQSNVFRFTMEKGKEEQVVNSLPLIAQLIDYAKHLEMIV